jgi:hypothetical protein
MSAVAGGEPAKVIMASVPKLGGGSLKFAIPAAFRPKVSEHFFTLTADLPGFPGNPPTKKHQLKVEFS